MMPDGESGWWCRVCATANQGGKVHCRWCRTHCDAQDEALKEPFKALADGQVWS